MHGVESAAALFRLLLSERADEEAGVARYNASRRRATSRREGMPARWLGKVGVDSILARSFLNSVFRVYAWRLRPSRLRFIQYKPFTWKKDGVLIIDCKAARTEHAPPSGLEPARTK